MNRRCGCEDGGNCTKTSVCAVEAAVEDAEESMRDEIEQWREWFEEYQLDISMAAQGASPANLEQAVEATRDCFICGGDGVVYDAKCDNCDGTGIQPETTKGNDRE